MSGSDISALEAAVQDYNEENPPAVLEDDEGTRWKLELDGPPSCTVGDPCRTVIYGRMYRRVRS